MGNKLFILNSKNLASAFLSLAMFIGGSQAVFAQQAFPKSGFCPSGYRASGSYCLPGNNASEALPKNGFCPSGYRASSNYCLKNK